MKCMALMLHANQFMDSLMQVPYAATGVNYFRMLQRFSSILTALQTPTASCTQQIQDKIKAHEWNINNKGLLEVYDEKAVTAFAATLNLQFWQRF